MQSQVASSAELAIRLRRRASRKGEVAQALSEGRLIKTWAMRGTLHLLTPKDAGAFLSLIAAGRSWETPAWERYFGMTAKHWDAFRPAVREALGSQPHPRGAPRRGHRQRGLSHIGDALRSGWERLKPLAWQGDLCFGPSRGARVHSCGPRRQPYWGGILDVEDAADSDHRVLRRVRPRDSGQLPQLVSEAGSA